MQTNCATTEAVYDCSHVNGIENMLNILNTEIRALFGI